MKLWSTKLLMWGVFDLASQAGAQNLPAPIQPLPTPPQVSVKIKVAEIDPDQISPAALEILLATTGAAFSLSVADAIPRPNSTGTTNLFQDPDQSMANATRHQFFGELTAAQTRRLQDKLTALTAVTWWESPEIAVESGRETSVQRFSSQMVITGKTNLSPTPGSRSNLPVFNYETQDFLPGLTINLRPVILTNLLGISLQLTPATTEFIGLDEAGKFIPTKAVVQGNPVPLTSVLPLPHFRVRQLAFDYPVVFDGQTLLVGGIQYHGPGHVLTGGVEPLGAFTPDQIAEITAAAKKPNQLLLFITPTLINPDGTRFHSGDEMPLAAPRGPVEPGEQKK